MKYRNLAAIALTLGTALTASAQTFNADSDNEWKKWRITGSIQSDVLVPQDDETIGTEKLPELPRQDQLILVYCRSGNRSKQAAAKLANLGYSDIREFGGILDWPGEIEK